jgi:hypothetical protein
MAHPISRNAFVYPCQQCLAETLRRPFVSNVGFLRGGRAANGLYGHTKQRVSGRLSLPSIQSFSHSERQRFFILLSRSSSYSENAVGAMNHRRARAVERASSEARSCSSP